MEMVGVFEPFLSNYYVIISLHLCKKLIMLIVMFFVKGSMSSIRIKLWRQSSLSKFKCLTWTRGRTFKVRVSGLNIVLKNI